MGAEQHESQDSEAPDDFERMLRASTKYQLAGRLGAGGMGVVYEALDLERGVQVALKTLNTTNAHSLYRFKQEFRALAEIVHPRLVRLYELTAEGERWYFSMELIRDGVSLLDWLRPELPSSELVENAETIDSRPPPSMEVGPTRVDSERRRLVRESIPMPAVTPPATVALPPPPSYERVREAFAQLAEGVQVLHAAGKLHRDLKPENVFVRSTAGQVVLLDFGLVGALTAPGAAPKPSSLFPVALPSDLEENTASSDSAAYHATQAGVIAGTFAYMAPEQALAQALTAAADWYAVGVMLYEVLTGTLPHRGSGMQMLMRKQSHDPVAPSRLVPSTPADLSVLCMELLRRDPNERPSGVDVVARLGGVLDDHAHGEQPVFIGREQQLGALRQAFAASEQGLAVAHVHGPSGAGKSSLLGRFLEELAARADTLVIEGRCYEQEFIPYKAIDGVMDALTRHMLLLSHQERSELLPDDAAVLSRLFPVIGRLFPSEAEGVPGAEDPLTVRQRAFAAVRELLARLGRSVRLVLFIDDLQWGDVDSAALLEEVLRGPDAPRLFLVLAYRSEHYDKNAGLAAISAASRRACSGERLRDIDVGSLGEHDARALALRLLGEQRAPWALDWTLSQANGSAFLIQELAGHLHAGRAPAQRPGELGLSLDDILWDRVRALPSEERALLTVVAIAGRPVRLRRVKSAAELSVLAPSVVPTLCSKRLIRTQGTGAAAELETFHDRVRESILARTAPAEVARLARALVQELERADEADAEARAVLYERAGDPGTASGYYAAAVQSAVAALAFENAERLAHKAIELAQTDRERAVAYEAAVHFHTDMAHYAEAYALTRRGVAALGVELPEKFVPPLLIADLLAVQVRMLGKQPSDLLQLPTMPEGRLRLAVRLANAGAKAAFQVRPELCVAVCTKLVRLCLAHGNSPDCAIAYMVFGAIFQGGVLGRYQVGYELGQLALALVDKYQNERQRAEVSFVVGYFGISWSRPARDAEALWRTAFDAGRDSGDLFHMGCAAAGRMMSYSMRGVPLERVERESTELCDVLARHGLREQLAVVSSVRQLARALRGRTPAAGSWTEADYDDRAEVQALSSFGARHFAHCCQLLRAQSMYLWGRLDEADAMLQEAARIAPESKGMLHSAEHVFLQALVTAGKPCLSAGDKAAVWLAWRKLQAWAARCPENFAHKAALVRAEALRVIGRAQSAGQGYERAVELAARFEGPHVAGMAHALAARLQRGERADSERAAARACFARWGADALSPSRRTRESS